MIIDCHTHLNHYADEAIYALPRNLDELRAEMKTHNIAYSCVLSSYKDVPGRPSIKQLVEATRDDKNILLIAGMSFLGRNSWDLGMIREYLKEGKVRGFKFYCGYEPYYPAAEEMWPVVDLAKEFDVPVYVHCGDTYAPSARIKFAHPIHIDDFAVDHPDLKIIICHLGSPWVRDTMEVVYKNKNVYTDISGLVLGEFSKRFEKFMLKQIEEMATFGVDPKKMLFGSDWPISSLKSYFKFIEGLKLTPENKRRVLGENSAGLFKIPFPA